VPTKEQLIEKLINPGKSSSFTKKDLFSLMGKCSCNVSSGGRGSGIRISNENHTVKLMFDLPHPQKELYRYQRKKVILFLIQIGEISDEK